MQIDWKNPFGNGNFYCLGGQICLFHNSHSKRQMGLCYGSHARFLCNHWRMPPESLSSLLQWTSEESTPSLECTVIWKLLMLGDLAHRISLLTEDCARVHEIILAYRIIAFWYLDQGGHDLFPLPITNFRISDVKVNLFLTLLHWSALLISAIIWGHTYWEPAFGPILQTLVTHSILINSLAGEYYYSHFTW